MLIAEFHKNYKFHNRYFCWDNKYFVAVVASHETDANYSQAPSRNYSVESSLNVRLGTPQYISFYVFCT